MISEAIYVATASSSVETILPEIAVPLIVKSISVVPEAWAVIVRLFVLASAKLTHIPWLFSRLKASPLELNNAPKSCPLS